MIDQWTIDYRDFSELIGKECVHVRHDVENDQIIFTMNSGANYVHYHSQDCCENVYLEDVCGDLNDLIGVITESECVSSDQSSLGDYGDSQTWSFYKFGTAKGSVTFRWYGSSNGYYSETAHFGKVNTITVIQKGENESNS